MRIRRHFTSLSEKGISFDRRRALRWLGLGVAAVLVGYLTAYLILFPAPILPGHQAVPRVLGLTVAEAQAEVQRSQLQMTDGGAEPHPTAPQGVIIWQDPPPGVIAPEGTKVTLVSSAGPPKIPVPDVSSLDARDRGGIGRESGRVRAGGRADGPGDADAATGGNRACAGRRTDTGGESRRADDLDPRLAGHGIR